jgi:phage virion morphogenesis protein
VSSIEIDASELDSHIGAVMKSLAPTEQAKLTRQIATYLQHKTQKDISAQRDPGGEPWQARKQLKGRSRNRKKMFVRMRLARNLKIRNKPGQVIVGWLGPAARVGKISQYGLKDPRNHNAQYAERVLIGLTPQDSSHISDIVTEFIAQG